MMLGRGRCWLLLILLACGALAFAEEPPAFEPIRVVVVRHAEKAAAPPEDPPLSEAGLKRANALAAMLETSAVTALYSSDRQRAIQTLEPLVKRTGLKVNVIDAKDIAAIVRATLTHPGGLVVVAAHSNTAGAIIEALGGERVPSIEESDFDNLYVVTIYAPGRAAVTRLRFVP